MKKIILTTAISALLSTSAFAAKAPGDIDFDGEIVNPSCEVALDNTAGQNFNVDLGSHQRDLFGPNTTAGKVDSTKKKFSIVATGFDCDTAKLTLKAAKPLAGVEGGFLGDHEKTSSTLAFFLENVATDAAVKLDGTTPVKAISTAANTTDTASSTYEFNSYLYNEGKVFPELGKYKAKVTYVVENL